MSNLMNHAVLELKMTGHVDDLLAQNVLALTQVFADQGHSGMSAGFTRGAFCGLASHRPIDAILANATAKLAPEQTSTTGQNEKPTAASDPEDNYGAMIEQSIKELLVALLAQHHDDASMTQVVGLFNTLANFKPASPLTGQDDEWMECGHGDMWQNKRCFSVFKDKTGVYDSSGKIFREPDGCCFTNIDSHVYITFPYIPGTEYVDVQADR